MDRIFHPQDLPNPLAGWRKFYLVFLSLLVPWGGWATPANRAAFSQHYDRFLARKLNQCTTCHQPSARENPATLDEFPHNPFGAQLRHANTNSPGATEPTDLVTRLAAVASLDADHDGVPNEIE